MITRQTLTDGDERLPFGQLKVRPAATDAAAADDDKKSAISDPPTMPYRSVGTVRTVPAEGDGVTTQPTQPTQPALPAQPALVDHVDRDRADAGGGAHGRIAVVEISVAGDEQPVGDSAAFRLWAGGKPPTFAYLAGAAGSGKTFLAKQWAEEVAGVELCATTGIAAINLGGTTINALLGYFDTKSLQDAYIQGSLRARLGRLWRSGVRHLVVDEVSMLDADQLTDLKRAIDEVNTKDYVLQSKAEQEWQEEFGAPEMSMMLVGDFCQLPPVKAEFAFESPEWPAFDRHTITLTEIRRQADEDFILALRAARIGDAGTVLDYFAGKLHATTDDRFEGSTLLAKNESVDRYNRLRMDRVKGREVQFASRREGEQRSEWGNPKKPPETWGIPQTLILKIGALVMILANRKIVAGTNLFEYVNGDLGEVVDVQDGGRTCLVRLQRTGGVARVQYVRREKLQPLDSGRRKELRAAGRQDAISADGKFEIIGWCEYMPIRVAFGTTVHKSQGLSLDAVQVTIGDHFFKTPGMLYVALSRARTAAGLRLVGSQRMLSERCTVHPKLVGRFL